VKELVICSHEPAIEYGNCLLLFKNEFYFYGRKARVIRTASSTRQLILASLSILDRNRDLSSERI